VGGFCVGGFSAAFSHDTLPMPKAAIATKRRDERVQLFNLEFMFVSMSRLGQVHPALANAGENASYYLFGHG
jgi:hypothetical protein